MYPKQKEQDLYANQYGQDWRKHFKFSPTKMLRVITEGLTKQLRGRNRPIAYIDLVRANVFTSTKENGPPDADREQFVRMFATDNEFDLHLYVS